MTKARLKGAFRVICANPGKAKVMENSIVRAGTRRNLFIRLPALAGNRWEASIREDQVEAGRCILAGGFPNELLLNALGTAIEAWVNGTIAAKQLITARALVNYWYAWV